MPKPSERGAFEHPQKSPFTIEKYDSSWEKDYMKKLEEDPAVVKWTKNHNIRIPYVDDAGYRKHFEPDFLIEFTDGVKEIHEVKGSHLMNRETELKANAAKLFCAARKMKFKLITK
ncbi:TnsA endonuclease N-terminal domain-containing protein [Patescibacteria group bacterium]|nr:TnsA endonuclease N-terminal domain-containing protein [Patescibacteria group bacterium]